LTVAIVLAAALAVVCVLAVALPFLREPEPESDTLGELDDVERRLLGLLEERDRALAALKELEFDHRTGAVSDEDYRALVGSLRREAASALRALEMDSELAHERPVQPVEPSGEHEKHEEADAHGGADADEGRGEYEEQVRTQEEGRPAAERTS
jgi:hypothetical protein